MAKQDHWSVDEPTWIRCGRQPPLSSLTNYWKTRIALAPLNP